MGLNAQKINNILKQANNAYNDLEYYNAAKLYERYFETGKKDQFVVCKLADCYWNMRQYSKAKKWYDILSTDLLKNNDTLKKRKAELYAMQSDYKNAIEYLSGIEGYQHRTNGFKKITDFLKDSSDWSINYLNINTQNYREFSPLLIGKSIIWSSNEPVNKKIDDIVGWDANGFIHQKYLPFVSSIVTRPFPLINREDTNSSTKKKVYARVFSASDVPIRSKGYMTRSFSRTRSNKIQEPLILQISKRLHYNVAHATASEDASKMYLSVNDQTKQLKSSARSLGIVEADIMGEYLSNPNFLPLDFIDSVDNQEMVLHAAINPTGEYLVFSSNRTGGKGGFDLYITKRSLDGMWTRPESLEFLNTAGNEVFSTFSYNNEFYFSSDGHPGLGGLDIYKVKTIPNAFGKGLQFDKIEYLPYPINSSYDDFSLVVSKDQRNGYFTSDRFGSDDIFSFEYKPKYIPLSGTVIDSADGARVSGLPASLYELNNDGSLLKVDSVITDKNGKYTFINARPNKDYFIKLYEPTSKNGDPNTVVLKASTEPEGIQRGLAVATVQFPKPNSSIEQSKLIETSTQSVRENDVNKKISIENKGLIVNEKFVNRKFNEQELINKYFKDRSLSLKSPADSFYAIVYFGFDKYSFSSMAMRTLDSVVAHMKANPDDRLILFGHTDAIGNVNYNIILSKNRVKATKKYITSKGIDDTRIELEYFGTKFPIEKTLSKESGKINRRVELLLFKK